MGNTNSDNRTDANQIKSSEDDFVCLKGSSHSMVFLEKNEELLVCDGFNKAIQVYKFREDSNLELIKTVSISEWVQFPLAVCVNANEIFVGCEFNEGICVFDHSFNFKRRFGENTFNELRSMTIENANSGESFLYLSHNDECKLTKWKCSTGELVKQIEIDSPWNLTVKDDKLFVISEGYFQTDESDTKLKCITKGFNGVLVLNKENMDIVQRIKIDDWLAPSGLQFDKSSNLLITALKLDNNNEISESRNLFVFDSENNFVREFSLNKVNSVLDMVLVKNTLLLLSNDSEEFIIIKHSFEQ